MTNSITIREYETKDRNQVINLIRLNTPKYFAVDEEEDLNKYLETERELYYVLLYDQKLVGCGGINFADNKTTGKISWDILHPDYQGKSLGTKLLKYRIDKLNSIDGIKKITVRTSQVAYKFYEKQGFKLFEIKKDYWAEGFDMYNMEYKQNENDGKKEDQTADTSFASGSTMCKLEASGFYSSSVFG
jgi:[ribosomal protein S18]-alanine N-acetyltransferase